MDLKVKQFKVFDYWDVDTQFLGLFFCVVFSSTELEENQSEDHQKSGDLCLCVLANQT